MRVKFVMNDGSEYSLEETIQQLLARVSWLETIVKENDVSLDYLHARVNYLENELETANLPIPQYTPYVPMTSDDLPVTAVGTVYGEREVRKIDYE